MGDFLFYFSAEVCVAFNCKIMLFVGGNREGSLEKNSGIMPDGTFVVDDVRRLIFPWSIHWLI